MGDLLFGAPDCPWNAHTVGSEACNGACGFVNTFGETAFDCKSSFFGGAPILSQAVGYGIVAGFGVFFALITSLIIYIDEHFGGTPRTSEQFNTAGRSLKTGLVACHIVSQWTWAATLLQSSNVAYQYGVSGPFWYAAGATIQVLLFGILAVQIKRKAPTAHTVLEIILARWGHAAHLVFMVFCFATNVIVTSMLLLGGSAVISATTGMSVYAAAFLIPMGVAFYTFHGGLKATIIAAYVHTAYIFAALVIFSYQVYLTNDKLGSASTVWKHLSIVSQVGYDHVSDNKGGSYLTMFSSGGLVFGIVNVVGNFGTVFVDQTYWQGAIAAKPSSSYKGYMLGGLLWFSIPFGLATSLGLAVRALDLPVSPTEAGMGLVPPASAYILMGKGGVILIVVMLFMAVTSAGSAEMIAVSSLCSYNIYRVYINPKATGKQMIVVTRVCIVIYAVLMGVFAIILNELNVSLGWVYTMMGTVIGSAVIPIYLCLVWDKTNGVGAMAGAIGGFACGMISWLVYASHYGPINLETTGKNYPVLTGNLVALGMGGLVCIVYSLIFPQNYDWESMKQISMIEHDGSEKLPDEGPDSAASMDRAYKIMLWFASGMSIILLVAWPLLALPAGVFSEGYFTLWATVSLVWGTVAAIIGICLPIFEARAALARDIVAVFTCTRHEPVVDYDEETSHKPMPDEKV